MSDKSYYKKLDDLTGFTYQDWEPKCLGEYEKNKYLNFHSICISIEMSNCQKESPSLY